jgi:hypothetical protein
MAPASIGFAELSRLSWGGFKAWDQKPVRRSVVELRVKMLYGLAGKFAASLSRGQRGRKLLVVPHLGELCRSIAS